MIRVRVVKGEEGYRQFFIDGHAGYAKKGKDIVCAAVSALVINAINSIERFTDDRFTCDCKEGVVQSWEFPSGVSSKTGLLMDSLLLGLQMICDSYGREYLQVYLDTEKMS